MPRQHLLTVLCSALQTDHRRQVAEIRVPTLIVQSREDPFVPRAIAEYLNGRIAGSRLAVVDAKGHLPHVTRPDLIVEQIRAFVAGLPPR